MDFKKRRASRNIEDRQSWLQRAVLQHLPNLLDQFPGLAGRQTKEDLQQWEQLQTRKADRDLEDIRIDRAKGITFYEPRPIYSKNPLTKQEYIIDPFGRQFKYSDKLWRDLQAQYPKGYAGDELSGPGWDDWKEITYGPNGEQIRKDRNGNIIKDKRDPNNRR